MKGSELKDSGYCRVSPIKGQDYLKKEKERKKEQNEWRIFNRNLWKKYFKAKDGGCPVTPTKKPIICFISAELKKKHKPIVLLHIA